MFATQQARLRGMNRFCSNGISKLHNRKRYIDYWLIFDLLNVIFKHVDYSASCIYMIQKDKLDKKNEVIAASFTV
jgi:hypothetical protein